MHGKKCAAGALLPAVIMLGLLSACGQQPAPTTSERIETPKEQAEEVDALVAATKQHPSLLNKEEAGPPIHVDPFRKSGGMSNHRHAAK
jgi:hypothetical protein